jgi:hypothetical protein
MSAAERRQFWTQWVYRAAQDDLARLDAQLQHVLSLVVR